MNWDEVEVDYTRRVYPVLNDLLADSICRIGTSK